MCDLVFKVNPEIKKEFLDTYPTATAKSNSFVLKLADEYEEQESKNIYDMTFTELKEMISIKFRNTSLQAIVKNVSVLRKYVDYCINNNLVVHNENRLMAFTRSELKQFVSQQAIDYKYISREELREYQNMLYNAQDIALIEAIYSGIRGRTTKDGTVEEIINLQVHIGNDDFLNNVLQLEKNNDNVRYIEVSDNTMQIFVSAMEQEEYVSNNGVENVRVRGGVRTTRINKVEHLVFRKPGQNKYDPFTPSIVQQRIRRIQEWCNNRFITVNSLYMSGMVSMAKDILKEKGELTNEDYIAVATRYDYGGDKPEKYLLLLKEAVEHYI
jgi:hypothetical protein